MSANTGDALGDTYDSIELFAGSNFADTIIGSDSDINILIGGGGGDHLIGGAFLDSAAYILSTQGIVANLKNPGSNTGEAAGDTYSSIEGLIGSNFNDTLVGDDNDNVLAGGLGADTLNGGLGMDLAAYLRATWPIVASLGSPSINTGEARGDVYVSIEGLVGSDFGDTLIGDAGKNVFFGGLGGDHFDGAGGDDA
ncbi:MAG TPA: hypothetical protein VFA65_23010, partial [Bryobacteraceae bacterium]|nr:hypothetical protein [Bryobacteraceae bacterium]